MSFKAREGVAVKLNTIITGQNISDAWEVEQRHSPILEDFWEVTAYPKEAGKTYNPPRDKGKLFDCVVLSQWNPAKGDKLGDILEKGDESWIKQGRSAHFIMTRETPEGDLPALVRWIDPKDYKGQMTRKWNDRSVEVLGQTDANQEVTETGQLMLSFIRDYANRDCPDTKLEYLGDQDEAEHSGEKGKITNIEDIRKTLELGKLPSRP